VLLLLLYALKLQTCSLINLITRVLYNVVIILNLFIITQIYMFKENKEFWLYILGTIVLMILLYFVVVSYQFPFVGFLSGEQEEKEIEWDSAPTMSLQSGKDYRAKINTNKGVIEIDLFEENAPIAVNNFVFLSNQGYYKGVGIHRVIRDFLIQTGSRTTLDDDKDNDALGDPGYYFEDEINWNSLGLTQSQRKELEAAGYSNDTHVMSRRLEKYSVAMANAGPDTNGSQFFLVTAGTADSRLDPLQGRHTVFGTVIGGFEVLDTINKAAIEDESDDSVSRPVGTYKVISVEIVIL